MSSKRERSQNFKCEEKKILLFAVHDHFFTIENKKTDKSSVKSKEEAWANIHKVFNANNMHNVANGRSLKSLKNFLDSWKRRVKTTITDEKTSSRQPGGGISTLDDVDLELLGLMKEPHITLLENEFDSDAPGGRFS